MTIPTAPIQERFGAAARRALAAWGMPDAPLRLIKYRENAVYEVDVGGGERFVLRLHRPGYHSDAALRSELQWMLALRDSGVSTASVKPTTDGSLISHVVAQDIVAEPLQCDMLSWLDGQTIGSIESVGSSDENQLKAVMHNVGQIAGRIHNQSAEWIAPKGFHRHSWDIEGCVGPNALWGYFGDLPSLTSEQRTKLTAAADRLREQLEAFGKTDDRYGLIHGDMLPENLLDDGNAIHLIDFDDCGFSWHMWELATALFWHFGDPQYSIAHDALIAGYRSVRPLPEAHVAMMPSFLLMRGLVYLGWILTRPETREAQENVGHVTQVSLTLADQILTD